VAIGESVNRSVQGGSWELCCTDGYTVDDCGNRDVGSRDLFSIGRVMIFDGGGRGRGADQPEGK
jgi:hypothetical protein